MSVEELPGLRPGARAYVFPAAGEEALVTRIEDFGPDWIAVARPLDDALARALVVGAAVEVEMPLGSGSLFLAGAVTSHRFDGVWLVVIRVDAVGLDPAVTATHEQRRHFRQAVALPLRQFAYLVERPGGRRWEEAGGVLRDLGGGGASVVSTVAVPAGTAVRLAFPVPLDALEFVARGTVVACRPTGTARSPAARINIRFEDVSDRQRDWLVRQLYRYQQVVRRR